MASTKARKASASGTKAPNPIGLNLVCPECGEKDCLEGEGRLLLDISATPTCLCSTCLAPLDPRGVAARMRAEADEWDALADWLASLPKFEFPSRRK